MDMFLDNILWHLMEINWEGPAMFAVIVLAILAVFRQWYILLITLLTIALGWGAEDLIVYNLETHLDLISVPLLIYCVGGGLAVILCLISFFKIAM